VDAEGQLAATTADAGPVTGLSGKCLTIQGAVTTTGTPVEISTCNSAAAQKWQLKADGTLTALGVCAAPAATTAGSAVQIKACSTTDATQQWKQRDDGTLYNPNSGLCLAIPGTTATDGTDLKTATCDAAATTQKWTITKQAQYLYDADGTLLIRRAPADGETVLYLGSTEVHLTVSGTTKTLTGARYYTAAGQSIAVRTATSGVTGTKLTFLAGDNHGTSSLAVDASTLAFTKRYTTPFGASRGTKSTWPDDKSFLGKPADTTTGLSHIGAREYDPTTARFISVDPLLTTDQAQSLNGYTYAGNNPATLSDPTGQRQEECSTGEATCTGDNHHVNDATAITDDYCARNGCGGTASTDSTGTTTSDSGTSSDDFDQVNDWLQNNNLNVDPGQNNYGCGAVSAGTNCSGILTAGQVHAQPFIELLDLTGAIGLLHCSQSLSGTGCGLAAVGAIPVLGKGFNVGEKVAKGVEDITHIVGKDDDPLVPELVADINSRYPGHVRAQGIDINGPDGKVLTDFDIVTRNA
jgi:RHS repeat-associated protein